MDKKEAQYWRLRAAFQELLNVTDEDVSQDRELQKFLELTANIALLYREKGAGFVLEMNRRKLLEGLGVTFLDEKRKLKKP